jgi:TonB-dependent receptor
MPTTACTGPNSGGDNISDKVSGLSFSGKYAADWGALEAIRFGLGDTRRAKSRTRRRQPRLRLPVLRLQLHLRAARRERGAPLTLKNFMRNGGGSFPATFVRFDTTAYFNALKALDGVEILDENGEGTGTYYDSNLMQARLNPTNSYRVTEDTLAGFFQADLSGDNWFANVGLRVVHTKTTSRTAVRRILAIDDPTPNDPTSSPSVTYSDPEPVSAEGDYTKLLPSANLIYKITPNLLLRAAAAKVMSRPSLDQLAPTSQDYTLDRNFRIDIRGSADLKPVEAMQGDLSLEWYYSRKSMLSGAVFWKDIKHFVTYAVDDNQDIGVPATSTTSRTRSTATRPR